MTKGEARSERDRGRPPRVDVRFQAWRAFLEAHAVVIPRVEQALERESGLAFTWYDVLFQLAEARDQRLRMHELAEAVLLSRSGLTRLVDRIETAGLVVREAIPGDRRSNHVALTEAGHRKLAAARPVATRAIREHFTNLLGEQEADALVQILGRLRGRNLAKPGSAPD